jgi:hypothetical protein
MKDDKELKAISHMQQARQRITERAREKKKNTIFTLAMSGAGIGFLLLILYLFI